MEKNAEEDKRTLWVNGLSDEVDMEILGGLLVNVSFFAENSVK